MKTISNVRTLRMVQLALFTAIILLLALTPIGFIKLPAGLSVTVVGIPVIIGAITLGPKAGAILGAVFGLASFSQAFGAEPFGTFLFSLNPIGTFITCLVPRILMGFLTGLVFQGLKRKDNTKILSYVLTSVIGSLLNTMLFMTSLMLFFYNNDSFQEFVGVNASNVIILILLMVGFNAIAEAVVSGIVGTAVSKPLDILNHRNEM